MAQARNYTKRIEIWKTNNEEDGFGGIILGEPEMLYKVWANAETKNAYRTNEEGQNDNFVQTVFTIRNRINFDVTIKDNFIKYNGLIYNIDDILNKNLDNIDIIIKATQRE